MIGGTAARLPHAARSAAFAVAVLAVLGLVAGCTNTPPPPLVSTSAAVPPPRPSAGEVVVGVDTIAGGYNPHKLADQSAVTSALTTLLLPSVFRAGPDGVLRLDGSVMLSAAVTRAEPYTVTYRIRAEASWSDSAPIAAEDFVYLRESMRDQPGVLGAAGYRLITDIASRDGGKVVEVTFARPYPGWRGLFGGLLPAHLLKDAPGGWSGALSSSFPATGGPFSLRTLDHDRGEIVVERNDRYWAEPAVLDRIVLRRGEIPNIADALRTGHDQLGLAAVDAAGATAFSALGLPLTSVPRPAVATLLLRPGGALAETAARAAVLAAVDRAALIRVGTGGGAGADRPVDAQVRVPSDPAYTATRPATAGRSADTLLTEAGYQKVAGLWTRAGEPLRLVVAAPTERPGYVAMAEELRRQLTAAGIEVEVNTPAAAELFTGPLAVAPAAPGTATRSSGAVDLAFVPMPAGGDPATDLATRFGCSVDGEGPNARTPTGNPAGVCDVSVQAVIDSALSGTVPVAETIAALEPALWSLAVAEPLYQEADLLAIRPEMSGVSVGSPLAGPFGGAQFWRKAAS